MTATHRCDPATDPRGGLVTPVRVVSAIVDSMDGKLPDAIGEVDGCQKCRTLFAITMSNAAARTALYFNSDAHMGYEMQLAAVQAAIERGETEAPANGFD